MCDYCEKGKLLTKDEYGNYTKINICNKINKAFLEMWANDYDDIEILYCPTCGRKLVK